MVANQFKDMHDALSELRDEFCLRCKNYSECMVEGGIPCEIIDRANMALAKKPRQCDIGTADEQNERFKCFCKNHQYVSSDSEEGFPPIYVCSDKSCPLHEYYIEHGEDSCELAWAQTPYAAEEGSGK